MLTSGDIQFEPTAGSKIFLLSTSMFTMTAGDSAIQAEITEMVAEEMQARIVKEPSNWWRVGEAADLYVKHYNAIKNRRAANAILSPLGLTHESFITNQSSMDSSLVNDLAKELLNFELPSVSAIFAGTDPTGTHIYAIYDNETNCVDNVGFAAIGIGSRHATSQFMFARHAWNSPFADTLLLTYYAKRKAEVAPGVGAGTDMVTVGPGLGTFLQIGDQVIEKLERQYNNITQSERQSFSQATGEIRTYVEELAKESAAAQASSDKKQAAPETSNGAPPAPDARTRESAEGETR